jgi:hypothetical protein
MIDRVAKDIVVIIAGIAVTIGLGFAAGWLLIPRLGPDGLPQSTRLEGSSAMVVTSGDLAGRFVLDQPLTAEVGDTQGGTAETVDLGITYAGSSTLLGLHAENAGVGEPLTGSDLAVEVVLNGEQYEVPADACVVELHQLRYVVLRPLAAVQAGPPRGVPLPAFAGRIDCQGITALDSNRVVNLAGVFRVDPAS